LRGWRGGRLLDAREAIRSSVTSEQYAVPDDEDPIEVTQTVTRERRDG
jgi:hypothetical protein